MIRKTRRFGKKLKFISYIYDIKARHKLNTLSSITTFVDCDMKMFFYPNLITVDYMDVLCLDK